jgi:hypothetical protein
MTFPKAQETAANKVAKDKTNPKSRFNLNTW